MSFVPAETDLGNVLENDSFSHTITYFTEEPIEEATVVIVPLQTNPSSISILGNTVSGYYFDSFDNTIMYRTPDGSFPVVQKFEQIDLDELYQMISYKASTVSTKIFTYRADAIIEGEVVASQVYTKTVENNWTSGKNSLQTFVGFTQ
jgi:hypothetical protein